MSSYWNIDSGDGNALTEGMQSEVEARRAAQRMANERGESVYLYEVGPGDGESEVDSEEIEPESDAADAANEHTPADAIAICRALHVTLVASDEAPGCVSAEPVPPKAARLLCDRLDAIGVLASRAEHEDGDGNRDGREWVYVQIDPSNL